MPTRVWAALAISGVVLWLVWNDQPASSPPGLPIPTPAPIPSKVTPHLETPSRPPAHVVVAPEPVKVSPPAAEAAPETAPGAAQPPWPRPLKSLTASEVLYPQTYLTDVHDLVEILERLKEGEPGQLEARRALYDVINAMLERQGVIDASEVDPSLVEALEVHLHSKTMLVRQVAMWGLGNQGYRGFKVFPGAAAVETLMSLAESGTVDEQTVALEAMDRMRDPRFYPHFKKALEQNVDATSKFARRGIDNLVSEFIVPPKIEFPEDWWAALDPKFKEEPFSKTAVFSHRRFR